MSFLSNGTEKDLNSLRNLAEGQKSQRAIKIENRILKQTHDTKMAGNLSPITRKLDEVNESTEKLGEIIEKIWFSEWKQQLEKKYSIVNHYVIL